MTRRGLNRAVRLPTGREWVHIALVGLMLVIYRAGFDVFYGHVRGAAFIISVVPVVVAGAALGIRAALVTVLVIAWLDRGLALSHPGPDIGPSAGVLSAAAKATLGIIVGALRGLMLRLRQVNRELERQMAARQAATAALGESLELYRSLVGSMGEGVGLFDREDRFLFANRAAEHILGAPPSGLVGSSLVDLLCREGEKQLRAQGACGSLGPVSFDVILSLEPYRILLVTETRLEHTAQDGPHKLRVFRDLSERARLERARRTKIRRTGGWGRLGLPWFRGSAIDASMPG